VARKREAGFTLVEVVIAFLILAIALLAFSSMVYFGIFSTNRSSSETVATNLAQMLLEEIKENPSNWLGKEIERATFNGAEYNEYLYDAFVFPTQAQSENDFYTAWVKVYFPLPQGEGNIVLKTFIAP